MAYETPSLKEIIPTKVRLPRNNDVHHAVAASDFSLGLEAEIESNANDPIILSFSSPKERVQCISKSTSQTLQLNPRILKWVQSSDL